MQNNVFKKNNYGWLILLVFSVFALCENQVNANEVATSTRTSSIDLSISFSNSRSRFTPDSETREILLDAKDASMIIINGRTSTNQPSRSDESLALKRALSARRYLIKKGVSPLKIMINYASAVDYITDNSTPEGRLENQRVDIELIFVSTYK